MLTQFRKHYPQGSLVSELVTIDHGKYIVRVLLKTNDIILGTGLAADNTIEIAEDRAIERALKSLKLENQFIQPSPTVEKQPKPLTKEPIKPREIVELSSTSPEKEPETIAKNNGLENVELSSQEPIKITFETSSKASKKPVKSSPNSKKTKPTEPKEKPLPLTETSLEPEIEEKPLPIPETFIEPEIEEKPLPLTETSLEPEIEEKPLPIPETSREPEIQEKPLPLTETSREPEIEEKPLPLTETSREPEIEEKTPVLEEEAFDFAEIIARSNVELKRLKWTTEQGREYLIKTYGKRSRQVLSDEELLEFLRYLESLSTPS